MRKIIPLLFLIGASFSCAIAQSNLIKFDNQVHDFGKFDESVNPSTHYFKFINDSKLPLIISQVVASCGCTSPEWPTDTIAPFAEGNVKVSYSSKNRIGEFDKSIEVFYHTDKDRSQSLQIIGEVLRPKKPVSSTLQPSYGNLSVSQRIVMAPLLFDNREDTLRVRVFNNSNSEVKASLNNVLPEYIRISQTELSIPPFENVEIEVIVDGKKIESYGYANQGISFKTNHLVTKEVGFDVRWIRKQFFPKMSARKLKKQPKFLTTKGTIDFGKYSDGKVRVDTIQFKNLGKKNLVFHEILPECSCIIIRYPKMVLKPQESMNVIVSFNPGGKYGDYTSSIWIVCNDPSNPESRVFVKNELPQANNKNCLSCPK